MYGLTTIHKLNLEAAEAAEILAKHRQSTQHVTHEEQVKAAREGLEATTSKGSAE